MNADERSRAEHRVRASSLLWNEYVIHLLITISIGDART